MFDYYDEPKTSLEQGCKRDLKAEAERLNKRLISNKTMLTATKNFIRFGDFNEIHGERRQQLYSLVGALDLRIEEQSQWFDLLLEFVRLRYATHQAHIRFGL